MAPNSIAPVRQLPARGACTPEQKIQFHIAEHNTLRAELFEHIKFSRTNFQYALVTTGGVFAWLATQDHLDPHKESLLQMAWFMPPALSVLFWLLSFAALLRIAEIARYLMRVEERLAWSEFGWQKQFMSGQRRVNPFDFTWLYLVGWIALTVGTLFVALYATGYIGSVSSP